MRIVPVAGHTLGHQILVVRLPHQGVMILSGDGAPCEENLSEAIVTRTNMDNDLALRGIETLRRLVAQEDALLIHGHDVTQWGKIRHAPAYYD